MVSRWLTFGLSAEEEDRFRQANFGADIAQARICIWLVIATAVAFAVNDYGFLGLSSRFYGLQALRVLFVAATFLLLKSMQGMKSYCSYDRAEFAWGFSLAIFAVLIAATRPHGFTGHVIAVVVCVFVTLLAIPNRFINQLIVSFAFTAGETMVVMAGLRTAPQASVAALMSMFMANSIAIVCAWQLHSWRRREFLAQEEMEKAKAEADRNLAEQKRVEEELRRSQRRNEFMADIIQQSSQPFAVGYPDGSLGLFNRAFEQLTGYSAEELGRIDWARALTPPEWLPSELASLEDINRTGQPVRYQKEYIRKDGSRVPIELLVHLVRDSDEKPDYYYSFLTDISERKRAEEALQLSEEKFAKAFAGNPAAIALTRLEDGLFLDVNDTWVTLSGFSREEAIGHSAREMHIWPTAEATARFVQALREKGSLRGWEEHFLKKSGEVFVAALSAQILTLRDEKVILSTLVDITAHKRAEEALQESEERLRLLGDNLPESAVYQYVHEPGGGVRFLYFSAGVERLNGVSVEDVLADAGVLHRQIPPEYIERLVDAEAKSARELSDFDMEVPMQRSDGEERWMRLHSRPRGLPDGRVIWDGVQIDVTEHKQAEEALRASEAKYRNLFENMTEEVHFWRLVRDENGQIKTWRVVDVNPPTLRTWGRKSLEDTIGRTADEIFPGATAHYMPVVRKIMTEGVPYSFEDYFSPPVDKYFRFTSVPFGEYFITTGADITSTKKAELALRMAHDELAKLVEVRTRELREKEVLLKEVHHRVKNNLQVISSLVGLQSDGSTDETVREVLRDVTYRVRSMALVHEKLYQSADLSRIDFAEYTRGLLGYLWRAHGAIAGAIRLNLQLEPILLPVDTAVPCGLILNELAGNALKHAFRDRSEGEVTVSLQSGADGRIRLSVADNGVGLPEDFDWREAKSLGLRLVRMLAGQLGGEVEVTSGEGTKFEIVFQVDRPKAEG